MVYAELEIYEAVVYADDSCQDDWDMGSLDLGEVFLYYGQANYVLPLTHSFVGCSGSTAVDSMQAQLKDQDANDMFLFGWMQQDNANVWVELDHPSQIEGRWQISGKVLYEINAPFFSRLSITLTLNIDEGNKAPVHSGNNCNNIEVTR